MAKDKHTEEIEAPGERNTRLAITLGVALICLLVVAGFLSGKTPLGDPAWDLRSLGFAATLAAAPIIGWYWLRNPLDLVVGVFLFCQAALAITGDRYSLWSSAIVFPAAALLLVAAGVRDHRKFLALRAEIRDLQVGGHPLGLDPFKVRGSLLDGFLYSQLERHGRGRTATAAPLQPQTRHASFYPQ